MTDIIELIMLTLSAISILTYQVKFVCLSYCKHIVSITRVFEGVMISLGNLQKHLPLWSDHN